MTNLPDCPVWGAKVGARDALVEAALRKVDYNDNPHHEQLKHAAMVYRNELNGGRGRNITTSEAREIDLDIGKKAERERSWGPPLCDCCAFVEKLPRRDMAQSGVEYGKQCLECRLRDGVFESIDRQCELQQRVNDSYGSPSFSKVKRDYSSACCVTQARYNAYRALSGEKGGE